MRQRSHVFAIGSSLLLWGAELFWQVRTAVRAADCWGCTGVSVLGRWRLLCSRMQVRIISFGVMLFLPMTIAAMAVLLPVNYTSGAGSDKEGLASWPGSLPRRVDEASLGRMQCGLCPARDVL